MLSCATRSAGVAADAAFCYVCMHCEAEKKFLTSTKRDPAFCCMFLLSKIKIIEREHAPTLPPSCVLNGDDQAHNIQSLTIRLTSRKILPMALYCFTSFSE